VLNSELGYVTTVVVIPKLVNALAIELAKANCGAGAPDPMYIVSVNCVPFGVYHTHPS